MPLEHIESHPLVAPLVARQAQIEHDIRRARRDLVSAESPDDTQAAVDRFLAGEAPAMPGNAAVRAAERQATLKVLEAALPRVRDQVRDACRVASLEVIERIGLRETTAAMRAEIFGKALDLRDLLAEAQRVADEVAFAELRGGSAIWPGNREGLAGSLAAFALELADAGCHLDASKRQALEVACGRRPEPPSFAPVRQAMPMRPAVVDDANIILE